MSTPESKVKKAVRERLDQFAPYLWYNMPVPAGYGEPMLDFVGCFRGRHFMVETKAEGKKLTPRQEFIKSNVEAAGGKVFVVTGIARDNNPDNWPGWNELDHWLCAVQLDTTGRVHIE